MSLSADWVVGFMDGEGCFYVGIFRNPETRLGYQVIPEVRIVQHQRDVQVLYALQEFFRCGKVCRNHEERWELRIRRREDLHKVCGFFEAHPLKTRKQQDFLKFRRVLQLMDEGMHLNPEGLREIQQIALSMNSGNRPKASALLDEEIVHPSSKEEEEGERNS